MSSILTQFGDQDWNFDLDPHYVNPNSIEKLNVYTRI
jgi:hypothetical protein